jgi:hypothetical protein
VLAEAEALIGDGDVTLALTVSAEGYVKVMGEAYSAYRLGEIEKPGTQELLDRALFMDCGYIRFSSMPLTNKRVHKEVSGPLPPCSTGSRLQIKAFTGI